MHKTTLLIPEDLRKRAQIVAKRNRTTVSEILRKQLEIALIEEEKKDTSLKMDPLFKGWNPSSQDVPDDLAANHDRYLYDL